MKLFRIFNTFLAFATIVSACSYCGNKDVAIALDLAESFIWSSPDSALSVLRSLDTLPLGTKASRARFSLLHTMALDRNGIDTTDVGVILPAVRYYQHHGSDEDRMKMSYYLGRLHHNRHDYQSAIKSYMRAREYSSDSNDFRFRGLISSAIADVYAQNYNYIGKVNYAEEACEYFRLAADSFRLWNTTGWLAAYYADCNRWAESDSLYAVFSSMPCLDSSVMARHLLNRAKLNMKRPDVNPEESVALFRESVGKWHGIPSLVDYCVYAYASDLLGDTKVADSIFAQLERVGQNEPELKVWKYRVLRHRGEHEKALDLFERLIESRDSTVLVTLNQSVVQAQSDYFKTKTELMEKERKVHVLVWWIIILLVLICVSSVFIAYVSNRKKWMRRVSEVSMINDEVSLQLSKEQDVSTSKDIALRNLRKMYVQSYKRQYSQLNDLCVEFLETAGSGKEKERIYAKVKRIVSVIDGCNQAKLERMIDENLNGIMKKLRVDLPDATDNEFRFIALNILGFDAKTIARIMGYAVQSVYTKRVRLRTRISAITSEYKDFYLDFID